MMSLYAYKTYLSSILYIFLIFQILLFQQKLYKHTVADVDPTFCKPYSVIILLKKL